LKVNLLNSQEFRPTIYPRFAKEVYGSNQIIDHVTVLNLLSGLKNHRPLFMSQNIYKYNN